MSDPSNLPEALAEIERLRADLATWKSAARRWEARAKRYLARLRYLDPKDTTK